MFFVACSLSHANLILDVTKIHLILLHLIISYIFSVVNIFCQSSSLPSLRSCLFSLFLILVMLFYWCYCVCYGYIWPCDKFTWNNSMYYHIKWLKREFTASYKFKCTPALYFLWQKYSSYLFGNLKLSNFESYTSFLLYIYF